MKFIKLQLKNRKKLVGAALLAVVSAAVISFFIWGRDASAAEYTTSRIERGNIRNTVSATGTVDAVGTVMVGSQASGTISAIYVDFNSIVKKGQVIAQLDPATVQAQVAQARANVEQVRSNVGQLRVGVEQARAEYQKSLAALQQARAGVTNANAQTLGAQSTVQNNQAGVVSSEANVALVKAQMDDARSVLTQDESLAAGGVISRRELQTSQTTFKTAEARYQQAVAQLKQARLSQQASVNTGVVQSNAGVQQAQAQVKQAEAQVQQSAANIKLAQTQVEQGLSQVEQAEAGLHLAEINQNNLTIISPIDGVVVSRSVEIGQTVAASLSAPTLFTIANDLTKMQVIANVDQSDIGLIENAKKANFTVDAFVGDEFSGTIRQIRLNPLAVQNVVTYNVVIDVVNPDLKLKPGMTANLEFTIDERENAVKIPNAALRFAPAVSPGQRVNRGNSNSQASRGGRRQQTANADVTENAANQALPESEVAPERPTPPTEAVLAGQTRMVWVLNAEQNLERRRIKIGITDGTATEVVEGNLTEGETVVTGQNVDTAAGNPSSQNGQTAPGFGGAPGGGARGRRSGGGR